MHELTSGAERQKRGLTLAFWIVTGGAALYLVASFLPFTGIYLGSLAGLPTWSSLWRYLFPYESEIADYWVFASLLAMGLVYLFLIIELFARRTVKALMAITVVLPLASLIALLRLIWLVFYTLLPQMRLGVELGTGFYLIFFASLIVFGGAIFGLVEKRRRTT